MDGLWEEGTKNSWQNRDCLFWESSVSSVRGGMGAFVQAGFKEEGEHICSSWPSPPFHGNRIDHMIWSLE